LVALLVGSISPYHSPTEWQRIGDEIKAASVTARAYFVNVHYEKILMSEKCSFHVSSGRLAHSANVIAPKLKNRAIFA
jgi:hypothetical protein